MTVAIEPTASVGEHQTERVPCRVEEDPKRVGVWLKLGFACTEHDDGSFTGVEIIDVEIEMGLLRMVGTRPDRRLMIGGELECQRRTTIAAELYPVTIVTLHIPTGDTCIELGETARVGAVEREE